MLVIGVTGGIGSGKSAATNIFSSLGITIIDADIAAREVVEVGSPALLSISQHFGQEILLADNSLNRAKLRNIIFTDKTAKTWLEQLTHPLIRNNILKGLSNAKSPYVILSSPLLIESGQSTLVRRVVVIDVSEDIQLSRGAQRDANSIEQIKAIMKSQLNRADRLRHADDIIDNNGEIIDLQNQIITLHEKFLTLSLQYES